MHIIRVRKSCILKWPLPYLKEEATVVFHDTHLQYYALKRRGLLDFQFTNNLLMSAVTGKKLLPFLVNDSGYKFSNIGAIELNSQTMSSCWDIFNLLTIEWVAYYTRHGVMKAQEYTLR